MAPRDTSSIPGSAVQDEKPSSGWGGVLDRTSPLTIGERSIREMLVQDRQTASYEVPKGKGR